jgi:Anti-sigma-D factor RsdA to sigma factor binding region
MPDFGRWSANGGDPSLNEINRTDRFLDALANQQPVYSTDPSEAELAHLLAGWRDEIRTPPLMSPVTPRDAVVALTHSVESRRRTRTSMAIVGSVAAAVLCLGGFGAVVAGAGPGDPLYGLHTMLFGEETRTDQVALASQQLAEVQQLINEGQWQQAQDKLQAVTTTVATVNDVEQKQQLVTQWQDLTVKVDAKDPNATLPPGVPPPVMPEPVVVAPDSTTSTTTSSETSGPTSSPSETTTPSSETTSPTTTPSSPTTSSPTTTTSSPAPEPPPPSETPTTTTTQPETTTTTSQPATSTPTTSTTTTRVVTTTTTTTSQAAVPPVAGPAAGGTPSPVEGGAPGVVGDAPAAGGDTPPAGGGDSPVGGSAQVVAPPTTAPEQAPRHRGAESPATQGPVTQNPVTENQPEVTIPVTTTTLEMPPPKRQRGNGE